MPILSFLLSPLGRRLGFALAMSLVLGFGLVQSARLKHAKADLSAARAALYVPGANGKPSRLTWEAKAKAAADDLETCNASTAALSAAIERQNSSVAALKAEGDRRAAETARAVQAAKKQGMATQAEADRILAIRARGNDTCQRLLDAERQITEGSR